MFYGNLPIRLLKQSNRAKKKRATNDNYQLGSRSSKTDEMKSHIEFCLDTIQIASLILKKYR